MSWSSGPDGSLHALCRPSASASTAGADLIRNQIAVVAERTPRRSASSADRAMTRCPWGQVGREIRRTRAPEERRLERDEVGIDAMQQPDSDWARTLTKWVRNESTGSAQGELATRTRFGPDNRYHP